MPFNDLKNVISFKVNLCHIGWGFGKKCNRVNCLESIHICRIANDKMVSSFSTLAKWEYEFLRLNGRFNIDWQIELFDVPESFSSFRVHCVRACIWFICRRMRIIFNVLVSWRQRDKATTAASRIEVQLQQNNYCSSMKTTTNKNNNTTMQCEWSSFEAITLSA